MWKRAIPVLAAIVALASGCGDDATTCKAKPKTGEDCATADEICSYSQSSSEVVACSCTGGQWVCQKLDCPTAAPATGDACTDFTEGARCEYSSGACLCGAGDAAGLEWRCD